MERGSARTETGVGTRQAHTAREPRQGRPELRKGEGEMGKGGEKETRRWTWSLGAPEDQFWAQRLRVGAGPRAPATCSRLTLAKVVSSLGARGAGSGLIPEMGGVWETGPAWCHHSWIL